MRRISIIGDDHELAKYKSMFADFDYDVQLIRRGELEKVTVEEDLALVVFPWEGYREIFEFSKFKTHLARGSVIVVGPSLYFYEVEDWVIEGSVCFVSEPVSSHLIRSVIDEALRLHSEKGRSKIREPSAA